MKEPTVYEKFVDTIKDTGSIYEVELPWKKVMLYCRTAIYYLLENWHILTRDQVLLKKYDQIIREKESLCKVKTVDSNQLTE